MGNYLLMTDRGFFYYLPQKILFVFWHNTQDNSVLVCSLFVCRRLNLLGFIWGPWAILILVGNVVKEKGRAQPLHFHAE